MKIFDLFLMNGWKGIIKVMLALLKLATPVENMNEADSVEKYFISQEFKELIQVDRFSSEYDKINISDETLYDIERMYNIKCESS